MATRKLKVVQDLLQNFTGSETTCRKRQEKNPKQSNKQNQKQTSKTNSQQTTQQKKSANNSLRGSRCRAKKILAISSPLNP